MIIKEIIPFALVEGVGMDCLSFPALPLGIDLLLFGADLPLVTKRK